MNPHKTRREILAKLENTMTTPADKIRVDQLPFSVEVYETTDLTDLLAPSNLIGIAKRGNDESRQSATARAFLAAATHLLSRENGEIET